MDKIDRFLYERSVDIQIVSGREQLQQYLKQPTARTPADSAQLTSQLEELKVTSGSWRDMSIADTKGSYVLTSGDPDVATGVSTQPEFKKAFASAVSGQSSNTDLFIEANETIPTMLFMAPIRDARASARPIIGVTVGELAWPVVIEMLQSLGDSRAELLNADGKSLGDNNPKESEEALKDNFAASPAFKAAQKSTSGSQVLPGTDEPKKTFVTSFVKQSGYLNYKGNGWVLILETPKTLAFAAARTLARNLIVIFMVIFLFSLTLFLVILNKQIIRPINNLKEAVARLSRGDFSLRTTITSHDELGELGGGFNDMADKIQFAYANLRQSTEHALTDKRTMETLLENLPVGVLVVEAPSGKPITMNRVAEQISGQSATTLNQLKSFTGVYEIVKQNGTPYPTAERPLALALSTGQSIIKDDTYIKRPNGEVVAVRTAAAPIKLPDGSFKTVVSVFEDISEQRNLERSREEFFSIASHELRTPLTAIRGNTSLIQDYLWDQIPNKDVKEMINDIHESSTRLISIVNDFLDTSRLEQERMNFSFEPIDMAEIAHSVIKEYVVTGSRQKIHLEINQPATPLPKVLADSNRTKQVLINLVGNALKFTETGSVTISFQPEAGYVKTLVTDTGKGIPAESQKFLFKKFEQTGTTVLTRDSVRGTGLGLYISKLIIEQMAGHIGLEASQVGIGTTFGFVLPIVRTNVVQPPTGSPKPLRGEIVPVTVA